MRNTRVIFTTIITTILICMLPIPAFAKQGLPNSGNFGYGTRLDMWGPDVYKAIDLASNMGLDWLAIDVDWSRHWPSLNQPADFSSLDHVLQAIRQKNISVLLSLNHAPSWALTETGPEPSYTNILLQSILAPYSDMILAVELFPGANTTLRWGTTPNPDAYLAMLKIARQGCDTAGRTVTLVTTIEPLAPGLNNGSIDERVFLERLYDLEGAPYLPIIGIRYSSLTGAPMTDKSIQNPIVLRNYESIRSLMLQRQHSRGMIWITGFSWPVSGISDPNDPLVFPITPSYQAQWVNQALQLLRAQLFIGTAFFSSLNQEQTVPSHPVLYQSGGTIHPASVTISQFAGGIISSAYPSSSQASTLNTSFSTSASLPTSPINFKQFDIKPTK